MKLSAGKIVLDYLKKFPNTPKLTLAKKIYKDYPESFKGVEDARAKVRYHSGAMGEISRKFNKEDKVMIPVGKAGWKYPLPPSKAKDWTYEELDFRKTIILSDIHIPFQDNSAINAVVSFARKHKPDCILLNGDIHDCYSISQFVKDPRLRNFPQEVQYMKQFFAYLRERFKCEIYFKLGNHEERFEIYMFTRAPDMVGTDIWEYEKLLDCENFGIKVVKDKRIIKLGRLPIIHGHEFHRHTYNPVNPARGLFLRGIHTALTSHWHQSSDHVERTMLGKVVKCWATGCLCDLHPDYARVNKWNQGFAKVELDKEQNFSVINFSITDGKIL